MEDQRIIAQSAQKYGGYCHTIAFSILSDR